jgi:glycogen synthase
MQLRRRKSRRFKAFEAFGAAILLYSLASLGFNFYLLHEVQNKVFIGTFCSDPHILAYETYSETNYTLEIQNSDSDTEFALFHVTKEFGPASMGGMGTAVSGLALNQLRIGMNVSVIMPYYKYLRENMFPFDKTPALHSLVTIHVKTIFHSGLFGILRNMFTPAVWHKVHVPVYTSQYKGLNICPGDQYPFSLCFSATNADEIYDVRYGITHEWQHLFFASAVASLVQILNNDNCIFQFHGASVGLVYLFLDTPIISVYSIHDYSFEPAFSTRIYSTSVFGDLKRYNAYKISDRIFSSPLSIDNSNATVFVSKYLGTKVLNAGITFNFKELMIPHLRSKHLSGKYYAISNGIDLSAVNPFESKQLKEYGVNFPLPEKRGLHRSAHMMLKRKAKKIMQSHYPQLDDCKSIGVFIGNFLLTSYIREIFS